jgi:hypothetical protein
MSLNSTDTEPALQLKPRASGAGAPVSAKEDSNVQGITAVGEIKVERCLRKSGQKN